MLTVAEILIRLVCESLRWLRLAARSSRSIKAENLFLRRQLALYIERGVKPRRIDLVTRIGLTLLSRCFNWRDALVVVEDGQGYLMAVLPATHKVDLRAEDSPKK